MTRRTHPETVLPTGWRIVGRDAESVAARAAQATLESMTPAPESEALFAVQITLPAAVRGRPSVEAVLDAISDEIAQSWTDCPRLKRDEELSRPSTRFGGLRYKTLAKAGREWTGEVVWRAAHPRISGAPITTHVIIEERAGFTFVSARVTADDGRQSVRGYVGAGTAEPAFLRALGAHATPTWLGAPLAARALQDIEVEAFVRDVLPNSARDVPIVVLAPNEDGTFVVDPADLMWELLGRARLYVIHDHRITYRLSDALRDRRLSCYWGAARCYFPDFTVHDDPRDHPLLVAERLADPLMRATWLGEIGMWTGEALDMPASISDRVTATVPTEAPIPTSHKEKTVSSADLVAELLTEMRNVAAAVTSLASEVEHLRALSAVRSASTTAIERRLGRLEDFLQNTTNGLQYATSDDAQHERPDSGEENRVAVRDVVQSATESHSDALMFLDSALASAEESPYEDPERVGAILGAMARVSRQRMDGTLGMSLRDAFSDLGIDYRSAIARGTSAKMREQYRFRQANGSLVEAEEHIALGNTYDPRRCLRIYFSSRVPNESRFVIAHVGRHFDVKRTT